MYIYRMPYPNELYHHGISGQKWGVRHGPPYPLKNGFASNVKKKGRIKSSHYEVEMASREKAATKQYEKLSKKAEKAKQNGKQRKYDKLKSRADDAQKIVEEIGQRGERFYSLSEEHQREISRGYDAAMRAQRQRAYISRSQDRAAGSPYAHTITRSLDKHYSEQSAENTAALQIDALSSNRRNRR